ncbi:MAG: hypothetical protein LBF87_06810 [Treponema sp.]|nr:hypothetical protein [Treponema sp.]
MGNSGTWMPKREQDFTELCQNWQEGLGTPANVTAFGWKQAEVDKTVTKIDGFLTARAAHKEDNSTKNRVAKDEAKKEAQEAMREFANTSIRYNSLMRPEDKLVYGIRPAEHTTTPSGTPETYPEADVDTSVIRQLTLHFWDSATKKRRKPHGVHGAEVRWALLDHDPTSEKELTNSDFDTASPLTLKFDESQRGKRVFFCLRWESTTNLKGPFGEIYSAIIP